MAPTNLELGLFILAIAGSLGVPYFGLMLFDRISENLRRKREKKRLESSKGGGK